MFTKKSLFIRKSLIPWHDSNIVCWIFILLLFLVICFAVIGIFVVYSNPSFKTYLWVPLFLLVLSSFTFVRIVSRFYQRNRIDDN